MCSTDATRAMPKHFGSDTHSPQWYDAPTTAISGANLQVEGGRKTLPDAA